MVQLWKKKEADLMLKRAWQRVRADVASGEIP